MTNFHRFNFRPFRCAVIVAAALTAGTAMAQDAGLDAACVPRLEGLQQRLFDKANQGPGALRDFMFARRAILSLDIYDTATWAEAVNEARAACVKNAARTQIAPQMASSAIRN
jgi:hypothetical protein